MLFLSPSAGCKMQSHRVTSVWARGILPQTVQTTFGIPSDGGVNFPSICGGFWCSFWVAQRLTFATLVQVCLLCDAAVSPEGFFCWVGFHCVRLLSNIVDFLGTVQKQLTSRKHDLLCCFCYRPQVVRCNPTERPLFPNDGGVDFPSICGGFCYSFWGAQRLPFATLAQVCLSCSAAVSLDSCLCRVKFHF